MTADRKTAPSLISRRTVLSGGLALAFATLIIPKSGAEAAVRAPERRLAFEHLHTGEHLKITYWQDGKYLRPALKEINHLLRDFRTNQVKAIDPKLLDLLHRLQRTLNTSQPFQVVSGYRSAKTNARLAKRSHGVARRSLHIKGKAIDIQIEGRDAALIRRAAVALRAGGVGYYPDSGFVHLDVGDIRYW
jgi:uncharacterized protein YcbK (DUF882 family)